MSTIIKEKGGEIYLNFIDGIYKKATLGLCGEVVIQSITNNLAQVSIMKIKTIVAT